MESALPTRPLALLKTTPPSGANVADAANSPAAGTGTLAALSTSNV